MKVSGHIQPFNLIIEGILTLEDTGLSNTIGLSCYLNIVDLNDLTIYLSPRFRHIVMLDVKF